MKIPSLIKIADFSRDQLIQKLKHLKGLADRPGYEAEGLAAKERMRVIQEKYGITDEEIFGKKPGVSKGKGPGKARQPEPRKSEPKSKFVDTINPKLSTFIYIFKPGSTHFQELEQDSVPDYIDLGLESLMQKLAMAVGYRGTTEALHKNSIYCFRIAASTPIFFEFLENPTTTKIVADSLYSLKNKSYKDKITLVLNGEEEVFSSPDEALEYLLRS